MMVEGGLTTFADTCVNGEVAPIPVIGETTIDQLKSARCGRSVGDEVATPEPPTFPRRRLCRFVTHRAVIMAHCAPNGFTSSFDLIAAGIIDRSACSLVIITF